MIDMNFSIERLMIPPEIHTYVFELNIMVPYLSSPRFWKWCLMLILSLLIWHHWFPIFKILISFFPFILTIFEHLLFLLFRGRLLIGTVFAFFLHMFVTYSINNKAINHTVDASSSSWLQEHVSDMSER